MGRGRIIAPVEGKPDWYLVRDDLGVQYQVQSGVEGHAYVIGKEYRLFTPGGRYDPCAFRLLPYGTSRRWRSARETAATHPATAAAMFIHNDTLLTHQPQDKTRTVASIAGSNALLGEGGRAALLPGAETLYQPGDSVAVIHDPIPGVNEFCIKKGPPKKAWIAGTGGKGPPKPADPGCRPLDENWIGYSGAADLLNGGASIPPSPATPGQFIYRKTLSTPNTIREWTLALAACYVPDAAAFGALCAATAAGTLALDAGAAEILPDAAAYTALTYRHPRPILMPPQYTGHTCVIAPPVVAAASVNRKLKCGARDLRMSVSLTTEDTHNHYTDVDGTGSGLMLPGCMILVFDKAPLDYLGAGAINAGLMQDGGGNNIYHSVYETNMDQPFKLVYARPDTADFSQIRTGMAGFTGAGQYALNRPAPRRTPGNGTTPITATLFRNKYNAPMDDPETGFGTHGQLLTRVFNGAGSDITPAPPAGDYCGGYFPGFFELPGSYAAVNLCHDFLAAYPFMANPAINPTGALPRLKRIVFYAQGKIWFTGTGGIGGNPVRVRCGGISLYHQ